MIANLAYFQSIDTKKERGNILFQLRCHEGEKSDEKIFILSVSVKKYILVKTLFSNS